MRLRSYNTDDPSNIMSTSTVLVIGATRKQGGATTNALLNCGFRVRALTRIVHSPAATRPSERGVEVVRGDVSDKSSLISALEGANAAYFTTDSSVGAEGEIGQGKDFIAAPREANAERVVYSSAHSADRTARVGGVPHLDSKLDIEKRLRHRACSGRSSAHSPSWRTCRLLESHAT